MISLLIYRCSFDHTVLYPVYTGGSQICHQECFDVKEAVKALIELAIHDTKIPIYSHQY